jgi:hypothetical protein
MRTPGAFGPAVWSPAVVRRARAAVLLAAIVCCELAVGVMLVDPRFGKLLLVGFAVLGLVLVFQAPFAATCGVFVLAAAVLEPGTYAFAVGPLELRLEELLLGALLLVALVRPRREWWGGAAGAALAAFLGAIAFSGLVAILVRGLGFGEVFNSARPLAFLALFYVVVRLFPEPEQVHRLLTAGVVVAAVSGVAAVVLALPGSPLTTILPDQSPAGAGEGDGLGALDRVRLPGILLAFPLLWYATVRWAGAARGERVAWACAAAAMVAAIGVSLNRNMWVGLAIGLALILAFGSQSRRRRFAGILLATAATAIMLAISPPKVSNESVLYPVAERGRTLFEPDKTSKESSLDERRDENRFAIAAIERQPILGVGPGAPFGRRGLEAVAPGMPPRRAEQLWVHNQYLHILLMGGVVALLPFVAFLGFLLRDVLRGRKWDDQLVALGVGLTTVMLSAVVMIYVVNTTAALTLGLLGGSVAVLASQRSTSPPVAGG